MRAEYWRIAATHEAAHAVAALALGYLVRDVTVKADGPGGSTGIPNLSAMPAADRAVILLAGQVAERMHERRGGPMEALRICLAEDGSNDAALLAAALKELAPDDGERLRMEYRVANLTWDILKRNEAGLFRLAHRLEEWGYMDGDEAAEIVGMANGKTPTAATRAAKTPTPDPTQGRPVTPAELRELAARQPAESRGRAVILRAIDRMEGRAVMGGLEYLTVPAQLSIITR